MSKKTEIRKIFKDFECEDFFKWDSSFRLKCNDDVNCNPDIHTEPIWTPLFGDEHATVMLVGEAPGAGGGIGPHLGGLFEDFKSKKEKPGDFLKFRDFFQKTIRFYAIFHRPCKMWTSQNCR